MSRVFVAMSGGVDSSVAAALLCEQGHDVTGVTMRLASLFEDACRACAANDPVRDAEHVCDQLGIPHQTLDFRELFVREVVVPYAEEYAAGRTPNPCARCNERVKFGALLAHTVGAGADYLATGHYARIVDHSGRRAIARARDGHKDQSYFLYRLTPDDLQRVLMPLGGLSKGDVREHARRLGLRVHDKPESQDVCFAPAGADEIVSRYRPDALVPGPIEDLSGAVLGKHAGIAHYTVGQRRGLGIGGLSEPLFVVRVDADRNAVVVGPHEALGVSRIEAVDGVWHAGAHECDVAIQTRYRMRPVAGMARYRERVLEVDLDEPVYGVAPGQAVVCYAADVVLGGGTISRAV